MCPFNLLGEVPIIESYVLGHLKELCVADSHIYPLGQKVHLEYRACNLLTGVYGGITQVNVCDRRPTISKLIRVLIFVAKDNRLLV